jgi:hypothetical protein
LLDQIAAVLDVALSGRGFPPAERTDAGDALVRRWVRDSAWKRDIVDVVYRRGRTYLTIGVSVEVPADGRHVSIDGTNVGYLVGRPGGYPLPHGWFRTWKRRRFLDRIDRDARAAVDWFDKYDSPRYALKNLQSTERHGDRVDSEPHREVVAFLKHLGNAHPSRRELIESFVKHVLVGPASGQNPDDDDRSPQIFGLGVICKALTGLETFEAQKVASPQDVHRALETAGRALEQDCAPILRGDLSIWTQLRA